MIRCLSTYRHYLASERRFKPHTLSEAEEKLMNDKDLTGISAWQKLVHRIHLVGQKYAMEVDGAGARTEPERGADAACAGQIATCAGARTRHSSARWKKSSQVLSFIYDTRFQDHLVNGRLRKYDEPGPTAPPRQRDRRRGRGDDDRRGRAELPAWRIATSR